MKRKVFVDISFFILLFFTVATLNAKTTAKKNAPDPEEILRQGREAFINYDFEEAADLYDEYRELKAKAKEPVDEELEIWENELIIASNAFDRVQKIVVIDSISLPRDAFFNSYRLSASAGKIGIIDDEALPEEISDIGFINETGGYILGPVTNSEGDLRIWEFQRLLDGSWASQESLAGDWEKSGDYAYPFIGMDGQTIYFANDGDESMGGYDLFVAQKDALTGEVLQPLNLGMPFNSPYDDIMLAMDEEAGLGWWATDRNSPDGNITVYVYLIEELRKNYPSDEENLVGYAKLTDYKATWEEKSPGEIRNILAGLPKEEKKRESKKSQFNFSLGNGKTYTNYSDFKNPKAKEMMQNYLKKKAELDKKELALKELRAKYKSDKTLKDKILKAEEEIENLRQEERMTRYEVVRLEKSAS